MVLLCSLEGLHLRNDFLIEDDSSNKASYLRRRTMLILRGLSAHSGVHQNSEIDVAEYVGATPDHC